jgi:hypothetical protein
MSSLYNFENRYPLNRILPYELADVETIECKPGRGWITYDDDSLKAIAAEWWEMREGFLRPELRSQSVYETYAFICDWIAVRLKRDGEFKDTATQ